MFGVKQKIEHIAEAEIVRARVVLRSMVIQAVFYGMAAMLGLVALVMLAVACALALSETYGMPAGILITAGIALLLALVLALLARPLSGRRARAVANQAAQLAREDAAAELAGIAELGRMVRRPRGDPTRPRRGPRITPLAIGALMLGVAAGISPRFRRLLLGEEE